MVDKIVLEALPSEAKGFRKWKIKFRKTVSAAIPAKAEELFTVDHEDRKG